jgi:low temperature requirement protein LtrA
VLTALPVSAAAVVLVIGGALGPPYQTALWAFALLVDYVGIWVAGSAGWRLPSPVHFAERFGLIVIVALGESLVAIGVGVSGQPVSVPVITASILGVILAVSRWWLYFDVVAHVAEGVLARTEGAERTRLARDSYTYLHFALGLKKVMRYVSDSQHHDLGDALTGVPLLALYVGVAVHLLGHVAFRRRNIGTWNPHRSAVAVVVAVAVAVAVPVAWRLPALAALAVVAGLLATLVGYEAWRFRSARDVVRHHS